MAVSVTVLGSGSKGNCTVLATNRTKILIDAGFSCRETIRRLRLCHIDPETVDAVVISHEHADHVSGVWQLARKLGITVYMNAATHAAWRRWMRDKIEEQPKLERLEIFEVGKRFSIGDVDVTAFTIPHDAVEPCGFTFSVEGLKVGSVTDLGYMPRSIAEHLKCCDGLMIESNHDLEMLRGGPYPWAVKQRVLSRLGHLSNDALAEFLASDYDGGAAFVILAHLSEQNNHPELARSSAQQALEARAGLFHNRLMLASQNEPLPSVTL